ncbi:MAG: precorrin-2 C(20)-methyltransferase [Desulfomonile tiedjei]|uniref:Precorrin-2 C(20)-methyltransferase n=1 Tax=Desulfomonile tiedjei TaxID=2358 RepID=A0A9D6Z0B7_9BACT|nr:precorrin-2 C(20)-methyltransferase [Desulfomonile tiedjei]
MKTGTLYGIGVGPGDPDLITVKAAKLLAESQHVFVPKARKGSESLALTIARKHINPEAEIHEVLFPMTMDRDELEAHWEDSARVIGEVLEAGNDVCFLTIGDAFLYSTYIYMLQALKRRIPDIQAVTVPGITAFSAAAALAEFPVGRGKESVTIVPTADDLEEVRQAVSRGGTIILMKIGKRLGGILDILENAGALGKSVFVSHAGMDDQRIETDLSKLRGEEADTGYMSIILVRIKSEKNQ